MDFRIYEENGAPILFNGEHVTEKDGLSEGMEVVVSTLWGESHAMIKKGGGDEWHAVSPSGTHRFMLKWREDYHGVGKCWTCGGAINHGGLEKVNLNFTVVV